MGVHREYDRIKAIYCLIELNHYSLYPYFFNAQYVYTVSVRVSLILEDKGFVQPSG